ncbi:MAG TPA: hypothetical protein VFV72_10755 [Candidatus Limnocylindrales bacterium]|nr:hypothetical protein [Candidatus Limnocylindrales bacterium]
MREPALRWIVAAAAIVALASGCSNATLPPPLEGGSPVAPTPTGASAGPPASPGRGSAAPASLPAGFSPEQGRLLASIREDARVGCAPRTENLPDKATAGVECTVGSELVDRVGVYAFATPADALAAYIARMASYGVALRSGDCLAGTAGDGAWTPGDGPTEGGDQPNRTGCFIDENGHANIRVLCSLEVGGQEIGRYIGVLGASTQIRPLLDWTATYAEGVDVPVPSPPGICLAG